MVWGVMIGLATIAALRPHDIWQKIDDVVAAVEHGSVITVVWGVRTLAKVAASDPAYRVRIFPVLTQCLKTCIPRDMPTHAENMLCAIDASSQAEFLFILEARKVELTPAQMTRLKKVIKAVGQPQTVLNLAL
jgi:hypothetical protein